MHEKRSTPLVASNQPNSRKVVIIGGSAPSDRNVLEQVRQQLADYSDQLQFRYLTNHTFQEISKEVAALDPESIALFVTLSRDAASRPPCSQFDSEGSDCWYGVFVLVA
jgi:hypothetical protein